MSYKVNIIIEKDDNGYYAYCLELDGCHSQGDTFENVISNIKEAVTLYIETLPEEEIKTYLSKEVLITNIEVSIA